MAAVTQAAPSPDAIVRKLFILTIIGVVLFSTFMMVMTHVVSSEPAYEGAVTPALVRLVPSE